MVASFPIRQEVAVSQLLMLPSDPCLNPRTLTQQYEVIAPPPGITLLSWICIQQMSGEVQTALTALGVLGPVESGLQL